MKTKKKRARQLGAIERDVLEELTLGDVMYAALFSARSTKLFNKLARERAKRRYRLKKTLHRLIELEYISDVSGSLSITESGLSALGAAIDANFKLLKVRSWDRKWRVAAFDIPEKYAVLRDKVRNILKRAGFVQLQRSLWVFPHDCEELVRLIKDESRLSKYILYGVFERIEDEERLKRLFSLG